MLVDGNFTLVANKKSKTLIIQFFECLKFMKQCSWSFELRQTVKLTFPVVLLCNR